MIALRRADVAELNTAGQELMERSGCRGPHRIVVGDTELAEGDRIICRRNDRTLGVRNGTRATIFDVDEQARAITIQTDRADTLTLPRRYLDEGHVQLGYAMTGHSSQSLTVERAFVLAHNHGEQREWATWHSHAPAAPPGSTSPKPPSRSRPTPPTETARTD